MNISRIWKFWAVLAAVSVTSVGIASAQHYLGVRAGVGAGNSRLYPERDTYNVYGLATGGFSWKYYSPEKILGGIEVDLLFIQQGFKFDNVPGTLLEQYTPNGPAGDRSTYLKRTVNSIMMPVFWQPHFYFRRQTVRVFINAGVTFSYNMSSKYEIGSVDNPDFFEKGTHKMMITRDNRWGYGLCAGGGIGWAIDKWEVVAEFRYYIGYSDIMRNRNKYPDNYFLRSPLDKMEINIGGYYRLGKGGILSPAGPKMQRKMEEWEVKRIAEGKVTHEVATQGGRKSKKNKGKETPATDVFDPEGIPLDDMVPEDDTATPPANGIESGDITTEPEPAALENEDTEHEVAAQPDATDTEAADGPEGQTEAEDGTVETDDPDTDI